MPVKIAVDAIPGMRLKGRVSKVNRYAEPSSFFSSSIKEYAVFIDILDPPENIRTGMTAEVQIFVEQLADVRQIPIQGLYEHGGKMYTLIQRGPDSFETSEVKIGATNDTMATIKEGLEEGDKVVLNLREHLNLMNLPDVMTVDNSDMRDIRRAPESPAGPGPGGPGGEGPIAERDGPPNGPGTGRPGGGRRDGGPPGRGGGPGGERGPGGRPGGGPEAPGGFGGGERPSVATIVQMSMQRNDKDGDGRLSAEEISAVDAQRQSGLRAADTDGDGFVTRKELTDSIQKRMGGG
jgi:hypothetical protein